MKKMPVASTHIPVAAPRALRCGLDRLRESRGQSMVEFALILPVLMLVLFGCVQGGLAFFDYEQVASAANAGARAAAINRAGDPTAAARVAAKGSSPSLRLDDSQIAVTYSSTATPTGVSWSYPGTTTVSISHPITLSLFGLFPQVIDLGATATKRVER
jgi:Flp pilus assembly protein TadG